MIELKQESDASSSSYPKAFSVTLYNITGGARYTRISGVPHVVTNKLLAL